MSLAEELFHYARQGNEEKLQEALKGAGPDEYIDYEGQTALVMALRNGHRRVAEILLEKGADVQVLTSDESTMLHHAVHSGDVETVKLVLGKVDVNGCTDEGQTPLHFAAYSGFLEICKLLVEGGANVNKESELGPPLAGSEAACGAFLRSKGAYDGDPTKVSSNRWEYGCFECEDQI